ncbi:hypothetical protein [Streptomyces griseorubiginosus]|uniref:hypothetical protein n=1 Tax=Streptomyces griseorubiginosus TaxID=67304 RepID=UPI0036E4A996
MNRITELWLAGVAPAQDGLFRADGSARRAQTDSAMLSWFHLGAPCDLNALLAADSGGVTCIDINPRCFAELPDGTGYVCGGGGSHGSEGFFARLDVHKSPVWVVSLGESNPFERVTVEGDRAVFINNLGNSIAVDLTISDFA